jgi:phosphatidylinositol alpha-mannosyltransferase
VKIGLISPYDWAHPGGVNTHIRCLSDQFRSMGHRTTIVAPASKPVAELDTDNLVVIGKPIPVPMAGSVARITLSVHRARRVKSLLEDEEFDVVHIHEPLLPVLPLAALRFSRSLNVGTFHAYLRRNRGYRALRPILKNWIRNLHGKIAVSEPAAGIVARYYPGYYNIIPNGIDLAHFSADVPPFEKYNDGKINILFVGRMEKRKGLQYLLAAYSRIKWEFPQVRLLIVGPGKLDAASERILGERLLEDVEFLGQVPYDDLPRYYRTADIFCSPATGGESFGIVLLEAMAAGTPVIASDIPGYATVIEDGAHGVLVPPKDDAALANALVEMIRRPDTRRDLGQRGRAYAQAFSWDLVARRVMDYYEQLLQERDPLRRLQNT